MITIVLTFLLTIENQQDSILYSIIVIANEARSDKIYSSLTRKNRGHGKHRFVLALPKLVGRRPTDLRTDHEFICFTPVVQLIGWRWSVLKLNAVTTGNLCSSKLDKKEWKRVSGDI